MDILKGAYWNVITLHIGYILKVSINRKCVYLLKMCLLNENMLFDWNGAYWMKMCLLNGHNSLGIDSGLYSFGNFFSTFPLSSFLKTQETYEFFSQISYSLPTPYRYFSTQWQFLVLIYTSDLKRWVDTET